MTVKIKALGEHNMFLLQDVVYYPSRFLQGKWGLPLKNRYPFQTASYYIGEAWMDVLLSSLRNSLQTDFAKQMLVLLPKWMITTNVIILKAQKERGLTDSHREEYLKEYTELFPAHYQKEEDAYYLELDGEMETLFGATVTFLKAFEDVDPEKLFQELSKYYVLDSSDVSEIFEEVCEYFAFEDSAKNELDSYLVMEGAL